MSLLSVLAFSSDYRIRRGTRTRTPHIRPREEHTRAPPAAREMPRRKINPRRCEGAAVREQPRAAAALLVAPAPASASASAPHHNASPGVAEGSEEKVHEGPREHAAAPGSARLPPPGPRAASWVVKLEDVTSGETEQFRDGAALAATPPPAPQHDAPSRGAGARAAGVKGEQGAEETLALQRDRMGLAPGTVRVDCRIKVEDSASAGDTDTDGDGEDMGGEGEDAGGEEEEEEGGPVGEEGRPLLLAWVVVGTGAGTEATAEEVKENEDAATPTHAAGTGDFTDSVADVLAAKNSKQDLCWKPTEPLLARLIELFNTGMAAPRGNQRQLLVSKLAVLGPVTETQLVGWFYRRNAKLAQLARKAGAGAGAGLGAEAEAGAGAGSGVAMSVSAAAAGAGAVGLVGMGAGSAGAAGLAGVAVAARQVVGAGTWADTEMEAPSQMLCVRWSQH